MFGIVKIEYRNSKPFNELVVSLINLVEILMEILTFGHFTVDWVDRWYGDLQ